MHVGIFGTGLTDSSEKVLKKILDENNISSSKIGTKSKSKKADCVAFSKKHKDRNNEDLYQYYEGALWALTYTLNLLEEK